MNDWKILKQADICISHSKLSELMRASVSSFFYCSSSLRPLKTEILIPSRQWMASCNRIKVHLFQLEFSMTLICNVKLVSLQETLFLSGLTLSSHKGELNNEIFLCGTEIISNLLLKKWGKTLNRKNSRRICLQATRESNALISLALQSWNGDQLGIELHLCFIWVKDLGG